MREMKRVGLFCALVFAACAPRGRLNEVALRVRVFNDERKPLADVPVLVDHASIGQTDKQGEVSAILQSKLTRARIEATCPDGYRPSEARTVPLIAGDAGNFTLEIACRPRLRKFALVVHAKGGAGLSVLADGVALGTVNTDETAHFVVEREPGTDLRLAIDTSRMPKLEPAQPVRQIRVSDRDDLVVFDQQFGIKALPKPQPKRFAPVAPKQERHVPYAISAGR